jgi:DNA repair protein RadA/Sms
VIVDSIQTLQTQDLTGVAGSVGQVRECAQRLQQLAKRLHIPIFLVGHVTKEGTVAGPRTLEHVVDVVLQLEGDSSQIFRTLRAFKNRFGPTDEVGMFEMEEQGMIEVKNPSQFFIEHKVNAPGSTVAVIMNGHRPLVVEIQAFVTKSPLPVPRRTSSGIDVNRLQLLSAVLAKRLNLALLDKDIFVNVTGGLRITEPAVDLAVCMAIASSLKDVAIPETVAFVGEVGLLGEIRSVRGIDRRSSEAQRLGFTKVISPISTHSLSQALSLLFK